MLTKFTVGNFLSFKDKVTFSLLANSDKEHREAVFTAKNLKKENKFIKAAAIYGLNGSGKSNFIKAIKFFRDFVADQKISATPFLLNTQTEKEPSFFEAEIIIDGEKYAYGFEILKNEIHKEWLHRTHGKKSFFERKKQKFDIARDFREGPLERDKITPEDVLLITNLAKFNGELSKKIVRKISDIEIVPSDDPNIFNSIFTHAVAKFTDDPLYRKFILDFMREADFGIGDIQTKYGFVPIEELTKNMPQHLKDFMQKSSSNSQAFQHKVSAVHSKFDANGKKIGDVAFDFSLESDGTKKAFRMAGLLARVLIEGEKTLIIDELNSAFHPMLCQFVLKKFTSKRTNPKNSTLLFTTHDVSLLDRKFLRRDQVWFVDKDRFGASKLFSLDEFGERKESSYSKRYLEGRYGAIPYIKTLDYAE